MDIRELAAVDMHGAAGTMRRRRIILIEFIAGAVLLIVFGVVLLAIERSLPWMLFGVWLFGIGLNYVPLSVYAIALSGRGALEAALDDVDVPAALRYYTVAQLWVFVPLSLVVMDLYHRRTDPSR